MKVLYVCGYASESIMDTRGDHETVSPAANMKVQLITEALVQAGHEVTVLSYISMASAGRIFYSAAKDDTQLELSGMHAVYPAACAVRPWGGIGLAMCASVITLSAMRSVLPDVVLVYNADMFQHRLVDWVKRHARVPVVLELEDMPKPEGSGLRLLRSWLGYAAWRRTREKVDAFILVSQELSSAIPQGARYLVVPGVVSDDLVQAAAKRKPPFCSKCTTVAYAGTLDERLGTDVLLETAKRLPAGFHFVFYGKGSMAPAVAQMARDYPDRISYMGFLPHRELVPVLVTFDCVVIVAPSSELLGGRVFPFKALEYVISGAHVIAGPLPDCGMRELDYIQRWDGQSDTLIGHVLAARDAYLSEGPSRSQAVQAILSRYSTLSLGSVLVQFLSDVKSAVRGG